MIAPIIGITTYRHMHQEGFPLNSLAEIYTQAISQAGGIPVLIPLTLSDDQLKGLIHRVDGILFSGGGDIDPARFGGKNHPKVDFVNPDRDRVEISLVRDAVKKVLPFLGICRGIQVVNVALGGSLYTDIADQLPGAIHHPHVDGNPRSYLAHEVNILSDTQLYRIVEKPTIQVNSLHHQGLLKLGSGLKQTAHASDGLIEAVELEHYPFGLAVQWHPEWLTAHAPMRTLFHAFIEAAGG